MNPFLITLLAVSQLFYSRTSPREHFGQIICSKPRCHDFYSGNGLSVYFTGSKYYYYNKRSTIRIFCLLENKSNDTLLFDRRSFSISSYNGAYILQPRVSWKGNNRENFPDTLFVPPGPDGKDLSYSFEFFSKNKIPHEFIGSDTLRFQYSDGGHTTTVFRLIAALKIDPKLTKEEAERAFTF
jgi:hypothetical protein